MNDDLEDAIERLTKFAESANPAGWGEIDNARADAKIVLAELKDRMAADVPGS